MKIKMVEDDEAIIGRVPHSFEAGEVTTVPDWCGRSFIEKGTAKPHEEDSDDAEEVFADPDERETKGSGLDADLSSVAPPVAAAPTTEGSSWYHFVDANGDLVPAEDGDVFKVQGTDARDNVLEVINDGTA